jgi:hypothetical protein
MAETPTLNVRPARRGMEAMTAFETSPHSPPAPPSCAIQPKALGARESYHVILTTYIPVKNNS